MSAENPAARTAAPSAAGAERASAIDSAIDPTRCPVCGAPNQCAMELERFTGQPQPPCWCTRARIPSAALDRVPAAALGRACLCPACAR